METEEALEVIWAFLHPRKVGFWCERVKTFSQFRHSRSSSWSLAFMSWARQLIWSTGPARGVVDGWPHTAIFFFLSVWVAQSSPDVYIHLSQFKISKSIPTCGIVRMQKQLLRRARLCSCLGNVKYRNCEIGAGCYPSLVSMFSWNQSWAGSRCQSRWLKFVNFKYPSGPTQKGGKNLNDKDMLPSF